MAFDFSAMAGNRVGWPGSVSPVTQITDLSAHVDGGPASAHGSNHATDWDDMLDVHCGVAIMLVIAALVIAFHYFMRQHIF